MILPVMSKPKLLKRYPIYVWFAVLGLFLFQTLFYNLGHGIAVWTGLVDRQIYPVIPAIDDAIPFWKPAIFVYIFTYAYWVWFGILSWKTKHENFINYTITFMLCAFIGFFGLVFVPTYIDREAVGIYQEVSQPGFLNWIVKFIFDHDGYTIGSNLAPSYHCLFCAVTIMFQLGRKEISWKWQTASVVLALSCCASTLLTKQHVFIDFATGFGFGVVMSVIIMLINPGRRICQKYEKNHPEGLVREN